MKKLILYSSIFTRWNILYSIGCILSLCLPRRVLVRGAMFTLLNFFYLTGLYAPCAIAQPAIEWQNTIGGSAGDAIQSIQQTSDGGYILGGYSNSGSTGDKTEPSQGLSDYWVVKLDSSGAIQWQNTIGGSSNDWLISIQQTSDGGYILGGYSNSNASADKNENSQGGSYDYWVVQLDASKVFKGKFNNKCPFINIGIAKNQKLV